MKSPIVSKRKQLVNAAMVQILHGNNASGQNEHNLDMFFKDKSAKDTNQYIGFLNLKDKKSKTEQIIEFKEGTRSEVSNDIFNYILDNCIKETVNLTQLQSVLNNSLYLKEDSFLFSNWLNDSINKNIYNDKIHDEFISKSKDLNLKLKSLVINELRNQKHYNGIPNIVSCNSDLIKNIRKENEEKQMTELYKNRILIGQCMSILSDHIFYSFEYSDSISNIQTFFLNHGYKLEKEEIQIISTRNLKHSTEKLTGRGIADLYSRCLHVSELKLKVMFLYLYEKSSCIKDKEKSLEIQKYLNCLKQFF